MDYHRKGLKFVGNADPNVSEYLKAYVMQGNTCVVGVIGEGTTREVQANWVSPFERDTFGSLFGRIEGLLQEFGGKTTNTEMSTIQTWEGNRPYTFNLVLKLYALSDAKKEVVDALQALEEMAAPELNAKSPIGIPDHIFSLSSWLGTMGRPPDSVCINIGRTALFKNCIIESISAPIDKERTKEGHLVRCEVSLQIQTKNSINKSQISETFR